MDEQWGYVGAKSRQRWLFYAYDSLRKTVVAHVFGDPRMKREGLHYVVIERNEKYMASFDEMVPEFIEKMDEALAEIGFVFGEQWR